MALHNVLLLTHHSTSSAKQSVSYYITYAFPVSTLFSLHLIHPIPTHTPKTCCTQSVTQQLSWLKAMDDRPKEPEKRDLYAELGIKLDASFSEIRSVYKRLALVHHPAKGGSKVKSQRVSARFFHWDLYRILRMITDSGSLWNSPWQFLKTRVQQTPRYHLSKLENLSSRLNGIARDISNVYLELPRWKWPPRYILGVLTSTRRLPAARPRASKKWSKLLSTRKHACTGGIRRGDGFLVTLRGGTVQTFSSIAFRKRQHFPSPHFTKKRWHATFFYLTCAFPRMPKSLAKVFNETFKQHSLPSLSYLYANF